MGVLGYVSANGVNGQTPETAKNMCWLVAGLYCVSALFMIVGIGVIYNLNKKTTDKMYADLADKRAAATAQAEVDAAPEVQVVFEDASDDTSTEE